MGRVKRFLWGTALLAGVNLLLRGVSVSFNAYVALKIGEESMGLFTLVMSVYGMAVTLATSGVNLAAVRLSAEKLAPLNEGGADKRTYKKCVAGVISRLFLYSLLFGVGTGILLFNSAPFVGKILLGDVRTVLSLKVLSVSLPAISLTAALSGYFTGVRKVYKNAASVVIEQGVKIALTSAALCGTVPFFTDSVEYSCLAVVGGAAVAEGFSLVVNVLFYIFDSKRPQGERASDGKVTFEKTKLSHVGEIALPIAFGAYARQGLSTAEHLFIPWGLRFSGLAADKALSAYGVLQGMVFPLLLLPSAVLSSAAGLLVPELAEMAALGKEGEIRRTVKKVYSVSTVFSLGTAAVFLAFAEYLGIAVYDNHQASVYLLVTAPLVSVMYFDMTADAMLKGLGEQVHSMKINIADSALSLFFALVLVPFLGIKGYIISVYVCESMNCILSVHRLKKVTGILPSLKNSILPVLLASTVAVVLTSIMPRLLGTSGLESVRLILCALIVVSVSAFIGAFAKKDC